MQGKLALSSKKAGTDGSFSVSGGAALGLGFLDFDRTSSAAANLAKRTAAPSDAQFTVNGVAITASSNKVTEALTGLELNLYKTGTATVTVTRDDDAVIKNVQAFVDGIGVTSKNRASLSYSLERDEGAPHKCHHHDQLW